LACPREWAARGSSLNARPRAKIDFLPGITESFSPEFQRKFQFQRHYKGLELVWTANPPGSTKGRGHDDASLALA